MADVRGADTTTASEVTYKVPIANWADLLDRLAKLAKKAVKLGCAMPVFTSTQEVSETRHERDRHDPSQWIDRVYTFMVVTLQSVPVVLDGWTLLATLDHTTEAGVVVRNAPGQTTPESFRTAANVCDHCGTRRNRLETFVLRHEDGRIQQIGRNCLSDFFARDAQKLAAHAEFIVSVSGACGNAEMGDDYPRSRTSRFVSLREYLAWVAKSIRENGWLGRKVARERNERKGENETMSMASADAAWQVWDAYENPVRTSYGHREPRPEPPTDADRARVTLAVEWARGLREAKPEGLNDYEHNLWAVCASEALNPRNDGVAASCISAYDRAMNVAQEQKVERVASVHVGTVGKREVFAVTVTGTTSFESAYGPRTLVRFADAAGNILTWWASGDKSDYTRGDTLTIKGTVKEHSVYKGTRQTTLSRVVDVTPSDEAGRMEAA